METLLDYTDKRINCAEIGNNFRAIELPDHSKYYISYNSAIIYKDKDNNVYLDKKYHNYSQTTKKHLKLVLVESFNQTQEKIKAGIYKLVNLNIY